MEENFINWLSNSMHFKDKYKEAKFVNTIVVFNEECDIYFANDMYVTVKKDEDFYEYFMFNEEPSGEEVELAIKKLREKTANTL